MGTNLRFMFLAGALLTAASSRLSGSGTPGVDTPELAPLILHSPTAKNGTLEPGATGQMLEPEATPARDHLSIGENYLGGQLRYYFTRRWASEFRFLMGKASSDQGTVKATVFGLRAYRFFDEHYHCKFYLGAEGDSVRTSIQSLNTGSTTNPIINTPGFGNTTGFAAGTFGGIEFRPFKRISIDLDAGPYVFGLKEQVTGVSNSTWDFVIDTAINVYIF